jgi:hypothetical protein
MSETQNEDKEFEVEVVDDTPESLSTMMRSPITRKMFSVELRRCPSRPTLSGGLKKLRPKSVMRL